MPNINNYEICRSVSKTVQEKQFEPKSHFSSHKMGFDSLPTQAEIDIYSKLLLKWAEYDVNNSINGIEKTIPLTPEQEYFSTPLPPSSKSDFQAIIDKLKTHLTYEKEPVKQPILNKEGKIVGKKTINKEENTLDAQ